MDTSLEIMKYSNLADAGYGQGLAPIGGYGFSYKRNFKYNIYYVNHNICFFKSAVF